MEPMHVDLFATKGLEYLLVISYLALLTVFWTLALKEPEKVRAEGPVREKSGRWFSLPDHIHFHQGHSWAFKEDQGVLRVGMDEFSRRLLGIPSTLLLPEVGTRLDQGGHGWTVVVDGKPIEMLSPVDGEVIEVNPFIRSSPGEALSRPYDDGWLFKVRANPDRCPLRNLLSGEVATAWIRRVEEELRTSVHGDLGVVLPDGGEPVDGLARALSPGNWDELAKRYLRPDPY